MAMAASASTSTAAASGIGSPCGACKFLRRKCAPDCVFAPYFVSEDSPAQFAAIHKVFGASNVSKLLSQLPAHHRCDAVAAVAYEAQARIRDPVYGCVGHIFALQKQVAILQAQLMQVRVQVAQQKAVSQLVDKGQCSGALIVQPHTNYSETKQEIACLKRWIGHGMDCNWSGGGVVAQPVQVDGCKAELAMSVQELWKMRSVPQHEYFGELQAMVQRLMRS